MQRGGGVRHIRWEGDRLLLLDQTRLPLEVVYITCRTADEVARAIREMRVRGAPAIGVAAAYGMALAALTSPARGREALLRALEDAGERLAASRPTAVNLFWAVRRMLGVARSVPGGPAELRSRLVQEAEAIQQEDVEVNRRIGELGAPLLAGVDAVLTHCNTGTLATAGFGTALGVIRVRAAGGGPFRVYADETRPFLQGARLTAWELVTEGIPVTLITDSMAGWVMRTGRVQAVIVGADRIAANGDVANKIGTYSLACLAKANGLPFYVAAPLSTVDLSLPSGESIPIEERDPSEVTSWAGLQVAPEGVEVFNPAFDVTPAELVTAIITEQGVLRPPYPQALADAAARATAKGTAAARGLFAPS